MAKDNRPLTLVHRPQRFADLVGNDTIRTILLNSIRQDKIRTGYFMTGGRGSGKTTAARIFAKAINCLNPQDGEPCNDCESCKLINAERSMDVIEIDAASENSVQAIRDLINSIQYAPINAKHKVVILDEVHCLTVQASNTLLKTLEEPPPHVVFIFCTTDPQKVLETIKSRTMMFQFQRLQTAEIKDRLIYISDCEGITYEESALSLIAFSVNGGMRDAITLLDQAAILSKQVTFEVVKSLVGFVSYTEIILFLSTIEDPEISLNNLIALTRKNSAEDIVNSLLRFLESLVFVQNSVIPENTTRDILDEQKVLSTKFDIFAINKMLAICFKTLRDIKQNNVYDSNLFLTDLYLSFYCALKGERRTDQLDANLLDIFRGANNRVVETTKEILKEFFQFKHHKGELNY